MSIAMAVVLAPAIGTVTFLYLSTKMNDQHYALQIMFFFLGLGLMILMTSSGETMLQTFSASSSLISIYTGVMRIVLWTFYISLVYFFIHFLYNIFMNFNLKKKQKKMDWYFE